MKKKKAKTIPKTDKLKHQFILTIRDAKGLVVDTISNTNYDTLMLEGMDAAKDIKGSWEIMNSLGIRLDGNYVGEKR